MQLNSALEIVSVYIENALIFNGYQGMWYYSINYTFKWPSLFFFLEKLINTIEANELMNVLCLATRFFSEYVPPIELIFRRTIVEMVVRWNGNITLTIEHFDSKEDKFIIWDTFLFYFPC